MQAGWIPMTCYFRNYCLREVLILGWWPALFCVRDKLFTCGLSATFYLWPECTTNLWPECTTRSPETAPPCVTALQGIVEPVIVVVVPILPICVLSLLHSLVSDQWSPSYYSHNSLPPRVGRVILNVHRDMLEYFTFLARGGRGGLGWDAETNAAQTF